MWMFHSLVYKLSILGKHGLTCGDFNIYELAMDSRHGLVVHSSKPMIPIKPYQLTPLDLFHSITPSFFK